MSERFDCLYKLPNNLYSSGAPIIISAGSLLKDTVTGNIVAQLKFHSVSSNIIKALKISLSAYDISGVEIQGVDSYQYLDLTIRNGQDFGSNKAIVMSNAVTRSFAIKSITVVMTDGEVQTVDMPLFSLPQCKILQSELLDVELVKQYKIATREDALYVPQKFQTLWECTCGEWNCGQICTNCKLTENLAFSAYDINVLSKNMELRLIEENKQKEKKKRIAEIENQKAIEIEKEKEKRKKHFIKKCRLAIAMVVPIIVISIIFSFWIYPDIIKPNANYKEANKLFLEGEYYEAAIIYEKLGTYKDSPQKLEEVLTRMKDYIYQTGVRLVDSHENYKAAITFGKLDNYKDAKELSKKLWADFVSDCTLSVNFSHSIAIKENGEIVTAGSNEYGQCNIDDWTNIVSVSAGGYHSAGLREDGTVIATGAASERVKDWKNIVAISAGGFHTVGIKSDGTVIAEGSNDEGQCNVDTWENIVAVSAGQRHTVGLRSDGTVVATGYNDNGQCNVKNWTDIVSISATMYRTVGLKKDGTVVTAGENDHGQGNVRDWENIVAIASTRDITVGLKSDGTVVATGYNYKNVCDVEDWIDIVAVATSGDSIVGLTSGGYIVEQGVCRHTFSGVRITDKMLSNIDTLSSKISGIDFGEDGYITYVLKNENSGENDGTNILSIYKNGAISLKRTLIRGGGLGPSNRIFLSENIAKWNSKSHSFTVDINDEITIEISILKDNATIEVIQGECDWGIEGVYLLNNNQNL